MIKPINFGDLHLLNLIKWMEAEVFLQGGDGCGIWYSRRYSVFDIGNFITYHDLFNPNVWQKSGDETTLVFQGKVSNLEEFQVTNDRDHFDARTDGGWDFSFIH